MTAFWAGVGLAALFTGFSIAGSLAKLAEMAERRDHRELQREHAFNMAKADLDAQEELRRADS